MIRRGILNLVALTGGLVGMGCWPGDDAAVSDASRATFRVEPAPSLTLGVVEGDPARQFDRVVAAFRLPGRRIAVADRGGSSIRVFAPDGELLETLGGPGAGPGEFSNLRSAWARGDTIEAWDSRLRRMTRFLPDGGVEDIPILEGSAPLDAAAGPVGEGWALKSLSLGDPRDRVTVELFGWDGEHRARLTELRGMARYEAAGMTGPHPLTPTALTAAHDGELYVVEADVPVVRVLGADGVGVREIRLPLDASGDRGEPDEVFRAVGDSALARLEEGRRDALRERFSQLPAPETLPVVWSILVDEEGLLWVRPYDPYRHALVLGGTPDGRPGAGGEWVVVDGEGAVVARVAMPVDLEPLQIRSDAVLGLHRNELDVEFVRVHALVRE